MMLAFALSWDRLRSCAFHS